jgi:serine/threonine protein phosphatase 1
MPPLMRWVIGDIHGMLRPLQALTDEVRRRDSSPRFLFTGDYVNRGPDSCRVIEFLLSLPAGSARFCRGNHDDILDLILNHKSYASGTDPLPVFAWFIAHGLDRTLHSYGIDEALIEHTARKPTPARLVDLVETIPPEHRAFFRNLPLVIEEPDIFVIHARWNSDESDTHPDLLTPIMQSAKMKHRVLWERFSDAELRREKHWTRRGFFGHTPVLNYEVTEENVPIVSKKSVLLDTGVALNRNGRLSAFCVETDQIVQVDHFSELLNR